MTIRPMTRTTTAAAAMLVPALMFAAPVFAQRAASPPAGPRPIDRSALLADIRSLSADSMEGRATGTPGGAKARRYLDRAFSEAGLEPVGASFRHTFDIKRDAGTITGVNFVGRIAGADSSRVIVISAHYDHLGTRGGQVFNGADDNASGTAGMLAIARSMRGMRPHHTILFVAMDAEEIGLRGARAFVADPPVDPATMRLDINLDMVSRNEKHELWVAGTHHYPWLLPLIDSVRPDPPVVLKVGHDLPGTGSDDWTGASDHGAFHNAGIPFLYFGVEDHPDYHRATDEFERIDPDFLVAAVGTIAGAVLLADRRLPALEPGTG